MGSAGREEGVCSEAGVWREAGGWGAGLGGRG